ncbi:MAG: hypothetical protein R2710_06115 [Acidimicrobiales bacterium]
MVRTFSSGVEEREAVRFSLGRSPPTMSRTSALRPCSLAAARAMLELTRADLVDGGRYVARHRHPGECAPCGVARRWHRCRRLVWKRRGGGHHATDDDHRLGDHPNDRNPTTHNRGDDLDVHDDHHQFRHDIDPTPSATARHRPGVGRL